MIYDSLRFALRYRGSDEKIALCLEKARELSENTPDGRYDLSEGVFVNISTYFPDEKSSDWKFETHEKFADLQLILSGAEIIGCASAAGVVPLCDYDEERDIRFWKGEAASLFLKAGDFGVFFPGEPHAPGHFAGEKTVKKAVFKIPFETV